MKKKTLKIYCDVCGMNCNAQGFFVDNPVHSDDPFDQLSHATFTLKAQCTNCSSFIATVAMTPEVKMKILTTPVPLDGVNLITFNDPYEAKRSIKIETRTEN